MKLQFPPSISVTQIHPIVSIGVLLTIPTALFLISYGALVMRGLKNTQPNPFVGKIFLLTGSTLLAIVVVTGHGRIILNLKKLKPKLLLKKYKITHFKLDLEKKFKKISALEELEFHQFCEQKEEGAVDFIMNFYDLTNYYLNTNLEKGEIFIEKFNTLESLFSDSGIQHLFIYQLYAIFLLDLLFTLLMKKLERNSVQDMVPFLAKAHGIWERFSESLEIVEAKHRQLNDKLDLASLYYHKQNYQNVYESIEDLKKFLISFLPEEDSH